MHEENRNACSGVNTGTNIVFETQEYIIMMNRSKEVIACLHIKELT